MGRRAGLARRACRIAQLASLARALARIAYGVPWLEELAPEAIEALLVAAARQVVPGYGPDSAAAATYGSALGRALTRRQRKLLEELAPHLSTGASELPSPAAFVDALGRAELRTAFVLTGDLLAVVDEAGLRDAALAEALGETGPHALAAVVDHPRIADVVRFALSADATALRRRVGSTWTR